MGILRSFLVLLVFQLAGETLKAVAHLPVPGPVLGMVLLASWYGLRKREPSEATQRSADTLLGWLGLLFVPAGVGIVTNLGLLRAAWLSITVGLVGSTLITLLVTGWLMQRVGGGRP